MRKLGTSLGIVAAICAALPFTTLVRGQDRPAPPPAQPAAAADDTAPQPADARARAAREASAREEERLRAAQALQAQRRKEAEEEAIQHRKMAESRAAAAELDLREKRRLLGDKLGRADVSAQPLRQAVLSLEAQREALELDDAGAVARRQALEDAIKSAMVKADDSANSDPAVAELKALVKVREVQVERMAQLRKAGAVPEAEIDNAQAQLAEARASLAQRQREAAAARGGDSLSIWNRELVELTIAQAERTARLAYINKRLKLLKDSMTDVDELERLEQNARQERAAAEAARFWADRQQRQTQLDAPAAEDLFKP